MSADEPATAVAEPLATITGDRAVIMDVLPAATFVAALDDRNRS